MRYWFLTIIFIALFPLAATSQEELQFPPQGWITFETQTNVSLKLYNPRKMTCPAMATTLAEIDQSGYRSGGISSVAPEDQSLYQYEADLSTLYYEKCGVLPLGWEQPEKSDKSFLRILDVFDKSDEVVE
jgi:hypothetical protein